jgi:hypothetical protein
MSFNSPKTLPNVFAFSKQMKVLNSVLEVLTFSIYAEIEHSLPPPPQRKEAFGQRKVNLFGESKVWHNFFFPSLNPLIYVGTTWFKVLKNGPFTQRVCLCSEHFFFLLNVC